MYERNSDALSSMLIAAALLGAKEKETQKTEIDGDKIRKKAEDLGNAMYHAYLGFKDAGFTDEQAFQIVLTTRRT